MGLESPVTKVFKASPSPIPRIKLVQCIKSSPSKKKMNGNILFYPAWSKKDAPKDRQDKWEIPIYI